MCGKGQDEAQEREGSCVTMFRKDERQLRNKGQDPNEEEQQQIMDYLDG